MVSFASTMKKIPADQIIRTKCLIVKTKEGSGEESMDEQDSVKSEQVTKEQLEKWQQHH